MKNSLLMISLFGLLSFSAFAGNDIAEGSCKFRITKNKAKSKYKVLRSSELLFDSIKIKPSNRFLALGSISKVYVNPSDVMKEDQNRVLIFSKDKDRLDVLGDVNYKVVDFSRAIYFTIEYIGVGMSAGSFSGPGVRVSTMTQRGKIAENFFGIKSDKETTFQANVPASTIYRVFDEVDGEPKHTQTKKHKSKMKLKCRFKMIEESNLAVNNTDEVKTTSGTIQE